MPKDFNINVSVNGGDARGAYGGGNLQKNGRTLNSMFYKNQQSGSEISGFNLKRVLNLGMMFNTLQKGNEAFGAFTNNRLTQRRNNVAMTFVKYGIGVAVNPLVGATYLASDLGYRSIMYNIDINKKNRKAEYFRELSGNNANSGRRYKGGFL